MQPPTFTFVTMSDFEHILSPPPIGVEVLDGWSLRLNFIALPPIAISISGPRVTSEYPALICCPLYYIHSYPPPLPSLHRHHDPGCPRALTQSRLAQMLQRRQWIYLVQVRLGQSFAPTSNRTQSGWDKRKQDREGRLQSKLELILGCRTMLHHQFFREFLSYELIWGLIFNTEIE